MTGSADLHLPEFESPPDCPVALLRSWLSTASEQEVREPAAMVLATTDTERQAWTRVVLAKNVDDRGIIFSTSGNSRKGAHIAENPRAAATFYWRETLQQINVAGRIERLTDEDSDALFDERPVAAQATTAVSRQSETLEDAESLRAQVARLTDAGEPLERPSWWGGFRLVPETIEFWHGSPDRLHRRLQYERAGDGWRARRLQP
ncbi:phenazine biosynthesis FMN-dependent oxidase PhzG [Actinopolyspora mzabensis]|uniref:phenazine biosynthesis FMN-dependent oxidase PhzG n=1 Tax=Actinopolyspora mzabensis TaxID=995066 RepID=UPI001C408F1F|nr:phenazine biosynthesis FMN-dependent oxidase PhzG [Actinopolyspora mzabensis]